MNREDILPYKGRLVQISIPHLYLDRPFFYDGFIKQIDAEYITLKRTRQKGIVQIKTDDIIEIKVLQGCSYDY